MKIIKSAHVACGLSLLLLGACKHQDASSSAVKETTDPDSDNEQAIEAMTAQLREAFAQLYADLSVAWNVDVAEIEQGPFGVSNEPQGLALVEPTAQTDPYTFTMNKLTSIDVHIAFITRELSTPNSLYHQELQRRQLVTAANRQDAEALEARTIRTLLGLYMSFDFMKGELKIFGQKGLVSTVIPLFFAIVAFRFALQALRPRQEPVRG